MMNIQQEILKNQSVILVLLQAETVVQQLSERGISVLSVVARCGRACIHIARHSYCDELISSGKASYQYLSKNLSGARQGVFNESGCRVYWSESVH
ncbi:TPA: hypothetical protein ACUNBO_002079 [Morganella morganii]